MKLRDATTLVRAMRSGGNDLRPSVRIDKTAAGAITFGVTATGRSLHDAAAKAMKTFTDLALFAATLGQREERRKSAHLTRALARSVEGAK